MTTMYIEPGSPWDDGFIESFNGKLRDELLNGEVLYTLKGAMVLIERWRKYYNTKRQYSSLDRRPTAPETLITPLESKVTRGQSNATALHRESYKQWG